MLSEAINQMKLATKQYAQRQVRWIRNKLLPAVRGQHPGGPRASLFVLDATGKTAPFTFLGGTENHRPDAMVSNCRIDGEGTAFRLVATIAPQQR